MTPFLVRVLIVIACGGRIALAAGQQPDTAVRSADPLAGMQMAVTVDDLPAGGELPPGRTRMDIVHALLAALRDHGVPAWGFANGYQVAWQPGMIEVLQAWLLAGNPLGNHGYHHADLNATPVGAYIEDVDATDRLLQTLSSVSALVDRRYVFRYPYLREGDTLAKRDAVRAQLAARGYRVAQVTVDYLDWAWDAASARCLSLSDTAAAARLRTDVIEAAAHSLVVARTTARQLFGRDIAHILLIHANAFTADTLPAILARLRSSGVKFITLEDALDDPVYQTNPNLSDSGGLTFLGQVEISRGIKALPKEFPFRRIDALCREGPTPR